MLPPTGCFSRGVTIETNELSQMVIRPTVKELARRGFALFVAGLLGLLEGERRLRRLVFTPRQARYVLRREQQEIIRTAPHQAVHHRAHVSATLAAAGGGMSGTTTAHSSSVRSLGYLK